MFRTVAAVAVSLAAIPVHAAAPIVAPPAGASEEDGALTLETKVAEVTVYADRARVVRRGTVAATEGTRRFAVRGLPGWIDEGSVRVQLVPPSAGEIVDVEVRPTFLAQTHDEDVRRAEARVREIADELAALDDEKSVLEAQARQIESIRAFSMEKLPRDMMTRDVDVASFAAVVDFVAEGLRKNARARRELEKRRRTLAPELAARQRELAELQRKAQLEQRTVRVTANGIQGRAQLEVAYLVPGATWEPVTELRARPDGSTVTLASFASVTQTTGESWEGASIRLSTQRPGATLRIPELQTLLVGAGGASFARALGAPEDSFSQALQHYQVKNEILRRGDLGDVLEAHRSTQARMGEVFASLQARGTTAHFEGIGVSTVRTDGRPVRVPLGAQALAAKQRVVAAPEVSLNAARILELVNDTGRPLLPGKVALYLDGAFLGSTETDFVAAGESFTLFSGTADGVKLARSLDRKRSSIDRRGRKTRMTVSFLVTAENLASRPVEVSLRDRIPVSGREEIEVYDVKVLPEIKPDREGLLKWEVALAPRESKTFRVEYELEYPTDLLQRMLSAPKSPSPMNLESEDGLYRQIDSLEKML